MQTEGEKSPGSLSPPPAFPSRFSGESHACRYLGWQSLRAGTERNRGSFICAVRRREKKNPPVRLSRSSLYNFLSISAPLTKPPPPLHVTQMCSGAVSVKRQREKDASGFLVQVSRQVTNCPLQPPPLLSPVQVSSPWYFGSETAVYYWEQNKVQQCVNSSKHKNVYRRGTDLINCMQTG